MPEKWLGEADCRYRKTYPLFPRGAQFFLPDHQRRHGEGWTFSVSLSRINKKTSQKKSVRFESHPPYTRPTALEARHWGATYALYRVRDLCFLSASAARIGLNHLYHISFAMECSSIAFYLPDLESIGLNWPPNTKLRRSTRSGCMMPIHSLRGRK